MSVLVERFADWADAVRARTETALDQVLPAAGAEPSRLVEAMRYTTLGGGKRVRPLLVHAAGEAMSAPLPVLDMLGCAVELVHVYSLVHDDMPCMDDDALRRGRPTVHVAYDEATALLVGDALQTRAFELITTPMAPLAPACQLAMARRLAVASGALGMAGGQAIDLASVGQALSAEALEHMHALKTGALIHCAVMLGTMAGVPDVGLSNVLDHAGRRLGVLFQVVDDLLDAEGDTATLGKTAGKDAEHDKPTCVTRLGLDGARRLRDRISDEIQTSLQPFGTRCERLVELAAFVAQRTH